MRPRLAAIAVLAAMVGLAALLPGHGEGQSLPPGVSAQPVLGPADPEMKLMGAASATGETWGYRLLPLSVGTVTASGRVLEFGPPGPGQPARQLVFLRHHDATGWQVAETPLTASGSAVLRAMSPNRLSARITSAGGGVLLGRDASLAQDRQVILLHRNPGGRFRQLAPPPTSVLLPGEALAGDRGSGRVAVAARDEAGRTGAFFAPVGPAVEGAVIHYDGESWTREPVQVPAGSEGSFEIVAISAADRGGVWALARTDPALGRGIVLLERTTVEGAPLWVERSLGAPTFEVADTPAQNVSAVEALGGAAQPITATADGVWIDGSLVVDAETLHFTLFYDASDARVTGSWCDAPVCDRPLGARFGVRDGYRSFAWPAGEFGLRVITNPLAPGGGEDTNRGTYLRFDGQHFVRMPGAGGNFRGTGAFVSPDDGWLEGPVEITAAPGPMRLRSWPVPLRAPLTDVAAQPGAAPGSLGAQALAVGLDGGAARYVPGRGWDREFLLSSSDSVNRATLRGVAWPEPSRAHAVGDLGAMWQWNADNDRWEPDPGAPIGFEANLMDIAFDPNDPARGYAVGRGGVILGYGKSWEPEAPPAGFEGRDLTQIAFAGSQALVAAGTDLLANDGSGWRVDEQAGALLDGVRRGDPKLYAVAGLPDGGAVAAGRDIVIERDGGPGSPWRFSDQPLPGSTVVALAAVRAGGEVRAVASVAPLLQYPPTDDIPPADPNIPPPIIPPFPPPGDGYVLRETDGGWVDDQRSAFFGSGTDRPIKSDPILAFALDTNGNGWAVGGWSGDADSAGRGSSARNASGRATRARVRTGGIYRYGDDAGTQPPGSASTAPVPLAAGIARLAVAGHAQCESACADLATQAIAPDRSIASALARVAALRGGFGPRLLLYTGGRVKNGAAGGEMRRYAELLGSQPSLPVYPALSAGDDPADFQSAFAGFGTPLGGAPAAGIGGTDIPGAPPGPGARTHYAFDSSGPGGTVRVVVIDNSAGSLAASDPHQNPAEAQLPWLQAVLQDARSDGIPVIVMGSRDLNTRFLPRLNVAADGDEIAQVLVEGGASAYVFDRPEENRVYTIPAGGAQTIPTFASGSLGYRSPIVAGTRSNAPDSLFGDAGFLMLEVDVSRRDPQTNRAPVTARLIPLIEDLSIEAVDGTLLRRSRPALFRGLGRRPRAGDRWGRVAAGDGNPDPPGADPYVNFPPDQCVIAGCSARVAPEYEFVSSDPDIADFVRQDPNSTNLRKPFLDPATDKVVSDSASGLLCPFNAGNATVTLRTGGFSFSQTVQVQAGSVQRPCGTRPLNPGRFQRRTAAVAPPPAPPPPAPASNPPAELAPPPQPPPAAAEPAPPAPALVSPAPPRLAVPPGPRVVPPPLTPVPAQPPALVSIPPTIPPPPPPPPVRPLPPGGAPARVYQVKEKREEEAAFEETQAFARFEQDGGGLPPYVLGFVVLAALAGASLRAGPRPRPVPADNRTRSRT